MLEIEKSCLLMCQKIIFVSFNSIFITYLVDVCFFISFFRKGGINAYTCLYVLVILTVHRLCPRPFNCPKISPPYCAVPDTFRYKGGLICPTCDKNICKSPKTN